jgi:hypothetical protein
MEDTDLDILIPALTKMKNLKMLWMGKNRINNPSLKRFLDTYVEN